MLEFDIQELEESFLLVGSEDDTHELVLNLLTRLLKGCSKTFTNNINSDVRKFVAKIYVSFLTLHFLSEFQHIPQEVVPL